MLLDDIDADDTRRDVTATGFWRKRRVFATTRYRALLA
jgi:hypothetical protein